MDGVGAARRVAWARQASGDVLCVRVGSQGQYRASAVARLLFSVQVCLPDLCVDVPRALKHADNAMQRICRPIRTEREAARTGVREHAHGVGHAHSRGFASRARSSVRCR